MELLKCKFKTSREQIQFHEIKRAYWIKCPQQIKYPHRIMFPHWKMPLHWIKVKDITVSKSLFLFKITIIKII